MRKLLPRAVAVVVVAFVPAACGGGSTASSSSSGSAPADVTIDAANLAFGSSSYTAKAGDFTIALDNQDVVEHNVTLTDGNKLLVEAGAKKKVTRSVTLAAGTYNVYCTIPGHNMKATLTVT
ncbi:MAG: cupredoxin domain-containing protein [Acidimicrobiales bacterium]